MEVGRIQKKALNSKSLGGRSRKYGEMEDALRFGYPADSGYRSTEKERGKLEATFKWYQAQKGL